MTAHQELLNLDNKVALVTGAARGIGRAVAELFSEAGANVALCDIDGETVNSVAETIPRAKSYACDIANEPAVEKLVEDVVSDFGKLDILIHVAAIFPKRDFLKMSAEQWDQMQAVNVRGTFLVMREAIKAMKAGGDGGAIVNVSSASGERALVHHNSAYGASKAAVTNLTRSVSIEVAGDGIRVNAILPGGVNTEGAAAAGKQMASDGLQMSGPITAPGRVPLGRVSEPSEIASACLFMASPAASYITGQALAVDGGFLVS